MAIGANVAVDAALIAPVSRHRSYGAPDAADRRCRAPLMAGNNGIRFVLVYTMGEQAMADAVDGDHARAAQPAR